MEGHGKDELKAAFEARDASDRQHAAEGTLSKQYCDAYGKRHEMGSAFQRLTLAEKQEAISNMTCK